LTLRDEYDALVKGFKHIHFGNKIQAEAVVEFKTDIQPSFHKNFDLISETLHKYLDRDYTIYILSDSEKQQKRLKSIFEDRGDNINFTPVERTLSEGFIDETLKDLLFYRSPDF
jgi:hypothetical protein